MWRFRYSLTGEARALTKFLKCVDWGDAQEARQAADLMQAWAPIAIADALELLSPDFSNEQVSLPFEFALCPTGHLPSGPFGHWAMLGMQGRLLVSCEPKAVIHCRHPGMTWLLLACLHLLPFALCKSSSDLLSHPVRYAAQTCPATVAAL